MPISGEDRLNSQDLEDALVVLPAFANMNSEQQSCRALQELRKENFHEPDVRRWPSFMYNDKWDFLYEIRRRRYNV